MCVHSPASRESAAPKEENAEGVCSLQGGVRRDETPPPTAKKEFRVLLARHVCMSVYQLSLLTFVVVEVMVKVNTGLFP